MRTKTEIIYALCAFLVAVCICFSMFNTILIFGISLPVIATCLFVWMRNSEDAGPYLARAGKRIVGVCAPRRVWAISCSIILLGGILYWLAYYPGGFNFDSYGQWLQAYGLMPLDNWHPVIVTLYYRLLIAIFNSFPICILVQLITFSVACATMVMNLNRAGISTRWCIIVSLIIGFNPAVQINNICLIKDVPFCVAIIANITMMIQIYRSDGMYLKKPLKLILFILDTLLILLIRYNGVFYVLAEMAVLIAVYRKCRKQIISGAFAVCVLLTLYQSPLLQQIEAHPHSNTIGEISGIPMAMMANGLLNDNKENLPEDVERFLLQIAPYDQWEKYYCLGEWDSCKWEFGGTSLLADASLSDIAKLSLRTFINCPQSSYQSIKANTRISWQILGTASWIPSVFIEANEFGIQATPVQPFATIGNALYSLSRLQPLGSLIWNYGLVFIALVLLLAYAIKGNASRKLLFLLPSIVYNLGTTLLLSGPNHRYFYFNVVIVVPIVLLMCVLPNSPNSSKGN